MAPITKSHWNFAYIRKPKPFTAKGLIKCILDQGLPDKKTIKLFEELLEQYDNENNSESNEWYDGPGHWVSSRDADKPC